MDDKHRKYLTDALESLEVIRNNLEEVKTVADGRDLFLLIDTISFITEAENSLKAVQL